VPPSRRIDAFALDELLRSQYNVITRAQALALGVTTDALKRRLRPGGPWQRLLPRVYLTVTGMAAPGQLDLAALLFAGPEALLTGSAAIRGLSLASSNSAVRDVLVPARHSIRSTGFVAVHPTMRMPGKALAVGPIRYAPPARAIADASRQLTDLREVRAMVAAAVQRDKCKISLLAEELDAGPTRGSALLRQVLAEVADGIRSAAEGDFMDLIRSGPLPMPEFNARLVAADGSFIAVADAWWRREGVVGEVDSRAWHLSPDDHERDLDRHDRMSRHGIIVLHFTPKRIRADRTGVIAELAGALKAGRARPPLDVRTSAARG
jgi:hypothetical protein